MLIITTIQNLASHILLELKRPVSCSSADETEDGDLDPDIKAQREKERRQANNARERSESFNVYRPCILAYIQLCIRNFFVFSLINYIFSTLNLLIK